MVEETAVATVEQAVEPVSPARAEPLVVTQEYVNQQIKSLELLHQLTKDVLVDGRDYGRVPGTQQFLWDPGANQLFGAFNVFPGHRRIISHIDDGIKISLIIEVPLIQRNTGAEVGSGIGASSTEETKHKYRWEENPEVWGYSENEIKTLKTKVEDSVTKYRIRNPEHAELLNVCVKQASKRAEVDGAESLPGVASTLRELFGRKREKKGKEPSEEMDDASPRWTKFWGEVRALGITTESGTPDSARVHQMLAVVSMKDWLKAGRSLDEAIKALALKLKSQRRAPDKVKEEDIANGEAVEAVMEQCYGWEPARVWAEANYANCKNFEEAGVETAWAVFCRLRDTIKQWSQQ